MRRSFPRLFSRLVTPHYTSGNGVVRESLPWALNDPVAILFFISLMPGVRHTEYHIPTPTFESKKEARRCTGGATVDTIT